MSKIQKAIDALDGCDEYSLRHHMSEISILIEGYAEAQSELAALREELATAKHDIASFLETTAKVCALLCIDTEDAKHAEGKPSDVLFSHATAMQQRLTAAEQRNAGLLDCVQEAITELGVMKKEIGFRAHTLTVIQKLEDAIKPTESGASE